MKLKLHIWRQAGPEQAGRLVSYDMEDVSPDSSFLEMLDQLNQQLLERGEEPVAFDHDCREGICGSCGVMINGVAHGPQKGVTACQLHMRSFRDGDEIYIEPWRARAFPIIRDLVVDRGAFDRIIASGGYVSVDTGSAPDANSIPIPKADADLAFEYAACIGCGACVASCKNASAMLFVGAKVSHLGHLPQGGVEQQQRVQGMVEQMDIEGFGNCTNQYECEAACPKEISVRAIADMNRNYLGAQVRGG